MTQFSIRTATSEDSALILALVKALARYEKAEAAVTATEADIRQTLFGENASAEAIICSLDQTTVGFAVYFFNYSTWLGKPGLYLEDLYIAPEYRNRGAGKMLLQHLARLAVDKGCGRMEWSVLDWNTPAIEFYQSIGAQPQEEWITYRLDGVNLEQFAS